MSSIAKTSMNSSAADKARAQAHYRFKPLNIGRILIWGLFALECAMDELAAKAGIDPIELRLKNFAERERNITRFNPSACNLIKQRLKHVMVHLIDNNYFFIFIVEGFSKLQTGKTTTNNYDFFACFHSFKITEIIF